jgi:cytochrome o ubiquinol oxidase subunit 2
MKSTRAKILLIILIFFLVGGGGLLYLFLGDITVLNPQGIIGDKQRDLIVISTLLMLIVVIPVFLLTFWASWRYRAENKKATYSPHWWHSTLAEVIWWGIPCIIIVILGVITLKGSHELDPFKPLTDTKTKPIRIQAVALQWKWLFIYPEQNIATINYVQFPEKTPLNFEVTADAPMNSFWIPALGGQIYAMPGMKSKLHLMADGIGIYRGSSANLSGTGFSGMTFVAKSSSEEDFEKWVQTVKESSSSLNMDEYKQLVKPSQYDPAAFFVLEQEGLFDWIIMKYMGQEHASHN